MFKNFRKVLSYIHTKLLFLKDDGFTLFEILISVSILAIIVAVSFTNLAGFRLHHNFDMDSSLIVDSLKNAQNRAILGDNGSNWGVKFNNNLDGDDYIEIFSGDSYSSSTVVTVNALTSGTSFTNPASGLSKVIIFTELTGISSSADAIIIKSSIGDDLYTISINSIGKISKLKETGLVGFWPMDEGSGTVAYDASVNSNNGTFSGSPTWKSVSNCKSGECLVFNGDSDYALVSGTSVLPFGSSDRTFSFWLKPTIAQSKTAVGYGTSANAKLWDVILLSGGTIGIHWYENTVSGQFPNTTYTVGTWQHVVFTYDGISIRSYINGNLKDTTSIALATQDSGMLNMGSGIYTSYLYFSGYIDDVRIYNRALLATEIKSLYETY